MDKKNIVKEKFGLPFGIMTRLNSSKDGNPLDFSLI
jgi:hypothetical protein